MNDAGYTLTETLCALAVVSLAISGLMSGVQVVSRHQRIVNDTTATFQSARLAQSTFGRFFEGFGPFRSHEPAIFDGRADYLQFDCGQAAPCSAELHEGSDRLQLELTSGGRARRFFLPGAKTARFSYLGDLGPSDVWPPSTTQRQMLRSVALVETDGEAEVAVLRAPLWKEQAVDCAFDTVLQDCR